MPEPSDQPEVDPDTFEEEESKKERSHQRTAPGDEAFSIQFGHNLYPLNQALIRQIIWLGKQLFARNGLLLPPLQLSPSTQAGANLYTVQFLSQEVGRFAVPQHAFLVLGEEEELRQIEPVAALNPHPLTGERMVWVFWGALHRVYPHDLFAISHLEFLAYFTNWLFHKNYVAFFTLQRCQQSLLAITEHVPTLTPLRGFFLKEMNSIWKLCLELLRKGASLRNFPQLLHEYHHLRTSLPPRSVGEVHRILSERWHTAAHLEESPTDLSSPEFRRLASGLIYMHASQAGWGEQLANRLTEAEINQLLATLLEIGGATPGARIPLTQEVISRLDAVFMGRTPQDYFEFLRQLLDGKSLDNAPLNAVDRFALLILSLPEGAAPAPEDLDFLRSAEKKALLGRVAFLAFHQYYGTFEHGPPTKHLMDVRDQVLIDFLDFVSLQELPPWAGPAGSQREQLNHWARTQPNRVVYLLLRHYFHVLDPQVRFAEAARIHSPRVQQALRQYFLSYAKSGQSTRLAPWRRGCHLLACIDEPERALVVELLESQGAWIRRCEPPSQTEKEAVLQEFCSRYWPHRSPTQVTCRWQ
jgi:hypothetical protein